MSTLFRRSARTMIGRSPMSSIWRSGDMSDSRSAGRSRTARAWPSGRQGRMHLLARPGDLSLAARSSSAPPSASYRPALPADGRLDHGLRQRRPDLRDRLRRHGGGLRHGRPPRRRPSASRLGAIVFTIGSTFLDALWRQHRKRSRPKDRSPATPRSSLPRHRSSTAFPESIAIGLSLLDRERRGALRRWSRSSSPTYPKRSPRAPA